MYMRIIWGRIASGQWDGFEAAYKRATALRGDVKGLKNQWLAATKVILMRATPSRCGIAKRTCVRSGIARSAKMRCLCCVRFFSTNSQ